MLASVLHPYKDSRGRYYPSILPFLVRRFGKDQEVEVVRSNLVRAQQKQIGEEWDASEGLEQLLLSNGKQEGEEQRNEEEDEVMVAGELGAEDKKAKKKENVVASGWGNVKVVPEEKMDVDEPVNGFAVTVETKEEEVLAPRQTRAGAALKRKSETFAEAEEVKKPAKRVDTKAAGEKNENKVKKVGEKAVVEKKEEEKDDGSDSDDEGSVQIDMSLDDSEDEEEEEEEEEEDEEDKK